MQLTVHPRNKTITLHENTEKYMVKKLSKLNKLFRQEPEVTVTQDFERGFHIVEITLHGDGVMLRSQERSHDLLATIDKVVDKLEIQWKRFKEKRQAGHRHPSGIKAEAEAANEPEEEPFFPRIVRRKEFPMKSMTPEDAAHQMELLGHSFFVFLDEESSRVAVLYRREGGDYGLIEPKV